MILDRLDACDPYRTLGNRFAAGFDYLRHTDFDAVADGRYEIGGPDVVAIVQTYPTRADVAGRWEAHRNHADIQYIHRGRERMGVAPLAGFASPLPPYDPDKDVEFYAGAAGSLGNVITVERGWFAVFLPRDVHMPNLQINGATAEVKKVVIKVRL